MPVGVAACDVALEVDINARQSLKVVEVDFESLQIVPVGNAEPDVGVAVYYASQGGASNAMQ